MVGKTPLNPAVSINSTSEEVRSDRAFGCLFCCFVVSINSTSEEVRSMYVDDKFDYAEVFPLIQLPRKSEALKVIQSPLKPTSVSINSTSEEVRRSTLASTTNLELV